MCHCFWFIIIVFFFRERRLKQKQEKKKKKKENGLHHIQWQKRSQWRTKVKQREKKKRTLFFVYVLHMNSNLRPSTRHFNREPEESSWNEVLKNYRVIIFISVFFGEEWKDFEYKLFSFFFFLIWQSSKSHLPWNWSEYSKVKHIDPSKKRNEHRMFNPVTQRWRDTEEVLFSLFLAFIYGLSFDYYYFFFLSLFSLIGKEKRLSCMEEEKKLKKIAFGRVCFMETRSTLFFFFFFLIAHCKCSSNIIPLFLYKGKRFAFHTAIRYNQPQTQDYWRRALKFSQVILNLSLYWL